MKKKVGKWLYWTPRILAIAYILFLALFSFDVFGNGYGFWLTLAGFLIHNIPSFFLTIILVISWRYEIVGGIAFILAGLLYTVLVLVKAFSTSPPQWFMVFWPVPIACPAFLVGILFLINWFRKKK